MSSILSVSTTPGHKEKEEIPSFLSSMAMSRERRSTPGGRERGRESGWDEGMGGREGGREGGMSELTGLSDAISDVEDVALFEEQL